MNTPKQPVLTQSYRFSSLPSADDHILIFTRSHIFYLLEKIVLTVIGVLVMLVLSLVFFLTIYLSPLLLIATCCLLITFGTTMVIRAYIAWYFHFYLVTTRKIVEVCNIPFGNYFMNEILLDRVKCTEVDITSLGIINQLFRIGDVVVTFDRPTKHRDSFVFSNVSNSNTIKELLTDYLIESYSEKINISKNIWYTDDRRKGTIYSYPIEELRRPKLHA